MQAWKAVLISQVVSECKKFLEINEKILFEIREAARKLSSNLLKTLTLNDLLLGISWELGISINRTEKKKRKSIKCFLLLQFWFRGNVILWNPGATSRDDAIFLGERYFRAKALKVNFRPKISLARKYRIVPASSPSVSEDEVTCAFSLIKFLTSVPF